MSESKIKTKPIAEEMKSRKDKGSSITFVSKVKVEGIPVNDVTGESTEIYLENIKGRNDEASGLLEEKLPLAW